MTGYFFSGHLIDILWGVSQWIFPVGSRVFRGKSSRYFVGRRTVPHLWFMSAAWLTVTGYYVGLLTVNYPFTLSGVQPSIFFFSIFCLGSDGSLSIYRVIQKDGLNFVSLYLRNWVHIFCITLYFVGHLTANHLLILLGVSPWFFFRYSVWRLMFNYLDILLGHLKTIILDIL